MATSGEDAGGQKDEIFLDKDRLALRIVSDSTYETTVHDQSRTCAVRVLGQAICPGRRLYSANMQLK